VLAGVGRGDWILCQVTSNPYGDERAVRLTDDDFRKGSLRLVSYARPGKLFTANRELVAAQVGQLSDDAFERIVEAIVAILRGGLRPKS